ncbi:unnamed protein product [Caretta caretta]
MLRERYPVLQVLQTRQGALSRAATVLQLGEAHSLLRFVMTELFVDIKAMDKQSDSPVPCILPVDIFTHFNYTR